MSHATPHSNPTPRAARAALTLRVWAAYIAAFGAILFVAPGALLEPFTADKLHYSTNKDLTTIIN